jgi:signal transduction histidine kinase
VWANPTALEQVFMNLLTNAVKFVARDVQPHVRVWSEICQGRVRLYIKDNGIGIAPEHHERIFGVFERLHKADVYPGTGIGLAIVEKAVQRMQGQIALESAVGQGSCFRVELNPG